MAKLSRLERWMAELPLNEIDYDFKTLRGDYQIWVLVYLPEKLCRWHCWCGKEGSWLPYVDGPGDWIAAKKHDQRDHGGQAFESRVPLPKVTAERGWPDMG